MNGNKLKHALLIVVLVFGCLVLMSFVNFEFNLGDIKIKNFSIFSALKSQPKSVLPDSLFSQKNLSDADSTDILISELEKRNVRIIDFGPDSLNSLNNFYSRLNDLKKNPGKIRIAYFGDSIIEGDLISKGLREQFQTNFGGEGVGFVNITSIVSKFRDTVQHDFSSNWKTFTLVNHTPKNIKNGISGFVFVPSYRKYVEIDSVVHKLEDSSWVSYKAVKTHPHLDNFQHVRLFYGPVKNKCHLKYKLDNNSFSTNLIGSQAVNSLTLNNFTKIKSVSLNFIPEDTLSVYGLSFESPTGVILDNFSLRSNNGLNLMHIRPDIVKQFNDKLNYNLIILQYGINVSNYDTKNYTWYENGYCKLINYLKKGFPNATILVVTPTDQAVKNGMDYISNPSLPLIVNAQKNAAIKTGVAYWDLFEAMGGENSIINWVNAAIPLANMDYTHLTPYGAKKLSKLFWRSLMRENKKSPLIRA